MKSKFSISSGFLKIAFLILLVTGIIKVISAFSGARILGSRDPVLILTIKNVYLLAGCLELLVCTFLVVNRNQILQLAIVAWLSVVFLIYHLSLLWLGSPQFCICLGLATDWFPWLAQNEATIMNILVGFLLFGSLGLLAVKLLINKSATLSRTLLRLSETQE